MSLPADLAVRAVESGDRVALAALETTCIATYAGWAPSGWAAPEVWPDRTALLDEPGRWGAVALDVDGALVGFVSFVPSRELAGSAHVDAVFVTPARWREGVAAGLLALAEAAMRERGFARADLRTPAGAPAEALYRTLGWDLDGSRDWHRWLGLAMVGYTKALA